MEEFPSVVRNIFFIPGPRGARVRKHRGLLAGWGGVFRWGDGRYSVLLSVYMWGIWFLGGRCLVMFSTHNRPVPTVSEAIAADTHTETHEAMHTH